MSDQNDSADEVLGLSEATPHYHGHRERLRGRFREAGADAVSDYELLELVLFRAIPQRDVKPLAKELIAKFGSFGEVVAAPRARLKEVKGIGEAVVDELKIVHAAATRMTRGQAQKRTVLSSWSSVIDYCRTAMAYEDKEQFRLLFLDKRNQLIADEVQQVGTVDHTPVYPREVVKRALELSATARDRPGAGDLLRRLRRRTGSGRLQEQNTDAGSRRLIHPGLDFAEFHQRPAVGVEQEQVVVVRKFPAGDAQHERKQIAAIAVELDLETDRRWIGLESRGTDLVAVGVGEFPGAEQAFGRIAERRGLRQRDRSEAKRGEPYRDANHVDHRFGGYGVSGTGVSGGLPASQARMLSTSN